MIQRGTDELIKMLQFYISQHILDLDIVYEKRVPAGKKQMRCGKEYGNLRNSFCMATQEGRQTQGSTQRRPEPGGTAASHPVYPAAHCGSLSLVVD